VSLIASRSSGVHCKEHSVASYVNLRTVIWWGETSSTAFKTLFNFIVNTAVWLFLYSTINQSVWGPSSGAPSFGGPGGILQSAPPRYATGWTAKRLFPVCCSNAGNFSLFRLRARHLRKIGSWEMIYIAVGWWDNLQDFGQRENTLSWASSAYCSWWTLNWEAMWAIGEM